ncbi:MAG TPA: hypothetical protein VL943_01880 [Niabella sp.]|nr:hypothetical protein [Niabella sp.]
MNSFINTLSDTVLSKKLEYCDLAELQRLSETHPYSSAIQLLYVQKLQATGNADYQKQLQKTLLYYNNPLFIKYLIETEEQPAVQPVYTAPVSGEDIALAETDSVDGDIQTGAAAETQPAVSEEPVALATTASVQEAEGHLNLSTQQATTGGDEPDLPEEANAEPIEPEEDAALLPLPEFKFEPIDPAKAELSFTPYHTIDYFAAQGIKLGEEQNSADRFGTQLKSFTAWLKQMKRLPGATAKGNISITEEKSIEQMAAQSLRGENADTEAMAQVWAQQGNPQKAIEIYKKLSLQIPAKSAYFAAKIDHLKK